MEKQKTQNSQQDLEKNNRGLKSDGLVEHNREPQNRPT